MVDWTVDTLDSTAFSFDVLWMSSSQCPMSHVCINLLYIQLRNNKPPSVKKNIHFRPYSIHIPSFLHKFYDSTQILFNRTDWMTSTLQYMLLYGASVWRRTIKLINMVRLHYWFVSAKRTLHEIRVENSSTRRIS